MHNPKHHKVQKKRAEVQTSKHEAEHIAEVQTLMHQAKQEKQHLVIDCGVCIIMGANLTA